MQRKESAKRRRSVLNLKLKKLNANDSLKKQRKKGFD